MLSGFIPTVDMGKTCNLLELVFDELGYRPLISNWHVVASYLLRRQHRQSLAFGKPELQLLYQKLFAMNPPQNWLQPEPYLDTFPMLTVDIDVAGRSLSMFSTLSRFGTVLDVGTEELIIESYFPANAASREFFEKLN
jgi:hypothetical protein